MKWQKITVCGSTDLTPRCRTLSNGRDDPAEAAARADATRRVRAWVDGLAPVPRTLAGVALGELTADEAGDWLGVHRSTVERRLKKFLAVAHSSLAGLA